MRAQGRLISRRSFCCYTHDELAMIRDAIAAFKWTPFNITFDRISCNGFHAAPATVDFLALLSPQSAVRMQKWIARLQEWVSARTKLPIHKPRALETPFHATLATVNAATFPIQETLNEIAQKVPVLQPLPMPVQWFFMYDPPAVFVAQNVSQHPRGTPEALQRGVYRSSYRDA